MKKTKPISRWPLISAAALLLVLLCIIWIQRSALEHPATTRPDPSSEGLRWSVGTSQQYQVQFDSSMLMNTAGTSGGQTMRVHMNCSLDFHTLSVSDQSALVGMQLSAIDLKVNGNVDPETNLALTAPFRVRYTSLGSPEAFEFPEGVSAKHRSMLENLVRTFQVTMEEGETWVAQETNASGSYEANYRRTAPQRVEKTKVHFMALPSATMLAGAEIISTESVQLDPQRDWVAAMTVDEVLRTDGQGGLAMEITNHATLELQPTVHSVAPNTWRFVAAATPPVAEAVKPIPRISPQQAHRQILAVLPELDTAIEGRSTWIYRLRDLLRVDASLPAMLLQEMKTQPFSDRTRADLYLAFELAGTEPAQAALVSVIEDTHWSTQDAMRAIVALAGVKQPSADTLAALWDTVDSVPSSDDRQQLVSTATLALGSLGSAMNATDDPGYPVLRDRLLSGALSSTGSESYTQQRKNYVHAMGNTGDASLVSDVARFLDDDDPAVRRAAALSLGMLGTDPVADELMLRLNQEKSSQGRGAIAESLVRWTTPSASAMASIGAAVREEPDENTRYHMARFLGVNLESFPENRAILQDLLRSEQSKRIRQRVAEMLAASSR